MTDLVHSQMTLRLSWAPRLPGRRRLERWARHSLAALRLKRLHTSPSLRIEALPGRTSDCVIVFKSLSVVASSKNDLEFARTASRSGARHCIFVTDKENGWYQRRGMADEITQTVRAYLARIGARRVMSMGYSMGGYGALVFADRLSADTALAIGPQYDIGVDAMPHDFRWVEEWNAIAERTLGPVSRHMSDRPQYFVLHGRMGVEILHWAQMPEGQNVHHYLVSDVAHNIHKLLRKRAVLPDLIDMAFQADVAAMDDLMTGLAGQRREPGETEKTNPNAWYEKKIGGSGRPSAGECDDEA